MQNHAGAAQAPNLAASNMQERQVNAAVIRDRLAAQTTDLLTLVVLGRGAATVANGRSDRVNRGIPIRIRLAACFLFVAGLRLAGAEACNPVLFNPQTMDFSSALDRATVCQGSATIQVVLDKPYRISDKSQNG